MSKLTPLKSESSSVEESKLVTTTNNWTRAAISCGLIKKTRSLPDLNISLGSNNYRTTMGNYHSRMGMRNGWRRTISLGEMNSEITDSIHEYVSKWSENSDFNKGKSTQTKPEYSADSDVDTVTKKVGGVTLDADMNGIGAVGVTTNKEDVVKCDLGIVTREMNAVALNPEDCGVNNNVDQINGGMNGNNVSAVILGTRAERKILEEPATTNVSKNKRLLRISPDTLVGSARKYRLSEHENLELKDSSEMVTLDFQNRNKVVRRLIFPRTRTWSTTEGGNISRSQAEGTNDSESVRSQAESINDSEPGKKEEVLQRDISDQGRMRTFSLPNNLTGASKLGKKKNKRGRKEQIDNKQRLISDMMGPTKLDDDNSEFGLSGDVLEQ